jgi:hypothetical protein
MTALVVDVGDRDERPTLVKRAHGRLAKSRGAPCDECRAAIDLHGREPYMPASV